MLGLNAVEVANRTIGDKPCLIVSRYDRTRSAHNLAVRLHQKDFCQAIDRPPESKYRQASREQRKRRAEQDKASGEPDAPD